MIHAERDIQGSAAQPSPPPVDGALTRAMEKVEAAAWSEFFETANEETIEFCGIKIYRAGHAIATFATRIDVLAFNRIIGLGLNKVSARDELEQLLPVAKASGVPRFFVQVNPLADTPELREYLTSEGLEYYNNWVRLHRDTSPVTEVKTDLRIERIGDFHAGTFGRLITDSFEWPAAIGAMGADLIGKPGWYHYFAFDKMKPVATAGMFVYGETAWIDFAATLADYRGRGAQA
ncbi:MAG: hypothetical protein ABIJ61_11130, partial [bacterium]